MKWRRQARLIAQVLGMVAGVITLFVLAWRTNPGVAYVAGMVALWGWWDRFIMRLLGQVR